MIVPALVSVFWMPHVKGVNGFLLQFLAILFSGVLMYLLFYLPFKSRISYNEKREEWNIPFIMASIFIALLVNYLAFNVFKL
jgi:hypothetical protein